MKPVLFYDTETSGLPLFNEPREDPRQPHIVQLAALLIDPASRQVLSTLDVIVRPDGWEIPEDVAAVHGITTEKAAALGVPEPLALDMLMALHEQAELRVAHNEPFDMRIVRIALKRYTPTDEGLPDAWKAAPAACTQRLSTPILQLPPTDRMRAAGRNHFKSANLGEAYRFFFGEDFDGAHNALADVQACMRVYFAIQDRAAQAPAAA
jgi:DNA polymerase-3 subunit epsilon